MGMPHSKSVITVNLAAFRHNLEVIKKQLSPATQIMAVVKADAYGHGSIKTSKAIEKEVQWLAVNDIREGIELRQAGIKIPILVFGVPEKEEADSYALFNLTATVSSPDHFELLPDGCTYHLNIDTGMGRLGILPEQVAEVISGMESHAGITCTGMYSHLATADVPGSSKAGEQLGRFNKIRKKFPQNLLTHVSHTGGSFFYQNAHFDMVRTGIGMYGYPPGKKDIAELKPALKWTTRLVQVKPVRKGDTVSYGARWQAPADGYVGIIPVGYEDGLRRALSGEIQVEIAGNPFPQVGTITMNYSMIYLGERPFPAGTKVQLLNSRRLTIQKWAELLDTIPYEILTSLSPEIPRIYTS